jgi:hypothetical protein
VKNFGICRKSNCIWSEKFWNLPTVNLEKTSQSEIELFIGINLKVKSEPARTSEIKNPFLAGQVKSTG